MEVGLLGLLAVFLCPMVFGCITVYYSPKTTHLVTKDTWEYWRNKWQRQ